jgi:hypothetical protein
MIKMIIHKKTQIKIFYFSDNNEKHSEKSWTSRDSIDFRIGRDDKDKHPKTQLISRDLT